MILILVFFLIIFVVICGFLFQEKQTSVKKFIEISNEKSELTGKYSAIQEQLAQKISEISQLNARIEKLSAEKIATETIHQEILQGREIFKSEFLNLSQEILENKKQKFSEETQKEVGSLIANLQQEFLTFKNEIFSPETRSRTELSTYLKLLFTNIEKMQTEAENLTNALRSNSKIQGNWGEIQLENLLEQAGLSEEHGDFIKQGKGLQLETETGIAKPDFMIRLPKQQWILIDAKVSLSAYDKMINAQEESQQKIFFEQHLLSLKKHIDEVAKYQNLKNKIDICPFLLMFLPIEAAYTSTFSNLRFSTSDLAEYARQHSVIIVYPSTLFLTLRLIQTIWQVEKQNTNAQEIAERGGKLYDKFSGLLDELRDLYKLFGKVNDQFGEKIIPKINGRSGLLSQCDELQRLGTKNKKVIKTETLMQD